MSIKNIVDAFGNIIEEQLHCTEDSHGLMCPDDKIKLANIEDGANKYTHPDTHPATIIEQDADHRFVTDNEKNSWNAKASTDLVSETAHGLMSKDDKTKLDSLENYEHPSSHDASIITQDSMHRFVTDAEKESWNAMTSTGSATENANGLMSKEDKIKLNSLENYVHPETHPAEMIVQDETHRFVSDTQISNWSNKATTDTVTATSNGLMSSDDKAKLDSLENYTHPETHPATMIVEDADHKFVTVDEKKDWGSRISFNKLNAIYGINDNDIIKVHFPHKKHDSGDCTIIETRNHNIMIDFGAPGCQDNLITYMVNHGITKIDYFIISHYHHDHIGSVTGVQTILASKNIDTSSSTFYLPHGLLDWSKCVESEGYYEELKGFKTQIISLLTAANIPYIEPEEGYELILGDGSSFKFINLLAKDFEDYYKCLTTQSYNASDVTVYNNFSMVVEMTYNAHKFLFTGDIHEEAQAKIYNRISKPNLLKAEHHFYNYGTNENFGKLLSPEITVVCDYDTGNVNSLRRGTYGIVMNSGDVYSTNISGDIIVYSTGFHMFAESTGRKLNYKDDLHLSLGTGIKPGTDLNEMFTPGVYFSESTSKTQTLLNTPENKSGFKLIIETTGTGSEAADGLDVESTRQTYITSNKRNCNVYTRSSYKGVYYDWVCMTHNSEGIDLVNGDDLNNCLLRSDYSCSNSGSSLTAKIKNKPSDLDSGFKLINHYISTNAIKQIIIPNYMSKGKLYMRSIIDNEFGDWYAITSVEDETKELWNGTWSSGSLTVTNAHKYRVLLLQLSEKNTMIPVFQYNGSLRGVGGFPSTTTKSSTSYNTLTTYQIDATYEKVTNGNKYTMKKCNSIDHVVNYLGTTSSDGSIVGPNTNFSSLTVTKIIGLLFYEKEL